MMIDKRLFSTVRLTNTIGAGYASCSLTDVKSTFTLCFRVSTSMNFLVCDLATYSYGAGESFSDSRDGAVVCPVATPKIAGSIGFILIRDAAWPTYRPTHPDASRAGSP